MRRAYAPFQALSTHLEQETGTEIHLFLPNVLISVSENAHVVCEDFQPSDINICMCLFFFFFFAFTCHYYYLLNVYKQKNKPLHFLSAHLAVNYVFAFSVL